MKTFVFKDRVKLFVKAGDGGNGIVAFRREKFAPRGGPNGGDGGHGGSVILRGDANLDSLNHLFHHPHQNAENGGHGKGAECTGRCGKDNLLFVPCGTVVMDPDTDEQLGEILHEGQEMILAQGGRGGLGNVHFKSSVNQAPTKCTPGTPGEERTYRLELKMMTDVGLVGYPNAGKSTLITELTDAHPKIAAYPFTTIHPILGALTFDDFKQITLADVPGLIDGASQGVGLGHYFLRHIERSRFLIFVIDMGAEDGRDPVEDYRSLRRELKAYNPALAKRPHLVLANKMDLPQAEAHLKIFRRKTRLKPIEISAGLGEGLNQVKEILYEQFFGK